MSELTSDNVVDFLHRQILINHDVDYIKDLINVVEDMQREIKLWRMAQTARMETLKVVVK